MGEVGCGGRFPSGMQGKRVHLSGWRGQWQIIDRVLGIGAVLPGGAGTVGPPRVTPRLWRTPGTQCCCCLDPAFSVTPFIFFPTLLPVLFQTLHIHCCQNPPTPAHFAWGKEKLQVYCQHSGVSKNSR